jgi:hypothetical protein
VLKLKNSDRFSLDILFAQNLIKNLSLNFAQKSYLKKKKKTWNFLISNKTPNLNMNSRGKLIKKKIALKI